jgi:hypothetical protein
MANYSPISLLTPFSKVFEKIVCERLLQDTININNIILEEQFGFRPATSKDKASYRLINKILNAMSERKVVGGIFCDLQKASECVNPNILTELECCGVTGTTLKLIKSYLEGRYQKVILDGNLPNSNSEWGEIGHGVPQESILGPLLFLHCINDLPKIVNDNAEAVLYADDTSIIIASLSPTDFIGLFNSCIGIDHHLIGRSE